MSESTSFGVALAAGKQYGLWDLKDHQSIPIYTETFHSALSDEGKLIDFSIYYFDFSHSKILIIKVREARYKRWKKAVNKSIGWDESDERSNKN
jgi:glycerol kinase